MENFKVKITKAKQPTYWYANKIGGIFEAVGVSNYFGQDDSFLVKFDGDTETFLVSWCDCTLFFDE
jgi:hypothetical protein